jgi:23S rRNA (uracil1939-C5)-methyltransferase
MKELQKNDLAEADIVGFSSDGSGVCRVGGRAVFVPRALPGEKWRVRIVKVNRTAVWGRGEELLSPVPERVEPACPVFGRCGGCATMHMDYACELRFKLSRLNDALQRIGGLPLRAEAIEGADTPEGYRNKGIYNFAPGPVAGFYRARSHDVISVPRCLLQPESFDRAAGALCRWMKENRVPAYDESTGSGLVRHLYLRKSSLNFSACIVSAGPLPDGVVEALRGACPDLSGITLCLNKCSKNVVLTDDIHMLWGSGIVTERLCGAEFRLSPLTFFQINTAQAEKLYRLAGEFAEPDGKVVLDLYCGAGTIGLSVARGAKKLIGNDIVSSAVENARFNAEANDVKSAEYLCGDAGMVAAMLARRGERPDVVLVDPPRKGLDEAVIGAICELAPARLVYVSCDPGTLARDLRTLDERGYRAVRCHAVDMFPRTRHVETVVLMSRAEGK